VTKVRRMQINLYLHTCSRHAMQNNSASRVVDESGLAECLN
jgi:hypothetical protein